MNQSPSSPVSGTINYQFKLLYAIGIWMVVAGHCHGGGVSLFYDWFPPYTFHLGLFVFASGYFYKTSSEGDLPRYIRKKIRKLILPLYLWNFFYAGFVTLSAYKGFTIGVGVNLSKLFLIPITRGHQFIYNLGGWFVIPLFMIEIIHILFRRTLRPLSPKARDYTVVITGWALGILGIYLSNHGFNDGWALVLTRMLDFLPFFVSGYFYKEYLEKKDNLNHFLYFGIVIMAKLLLITIYGNIQSFEQAWSNYGGFGPVVVYLYGFLAIAFWLRISRILTPAFGRNKWVNRIADNAYSIMIHQFLGFMFIKTCFALINKFTPYCHTFDWIAYKTDIWYYYLPNGSTQSLIIYVIAGITLPILIQGCVTYAKRKIQTVRSHNTP